MRMLPGPLMAFSEKRKMERQPTVGASCLKLCQAILARFYVLACRREPDQRELWQGRHLPFARSQVASWLAQKRPATRRPRSTTHPIGGSGVMKAPIASEMPAMTKASASCFLENLRVFEDGVCALVGCLLGSVGGEVIVAGL